MKILTPILLAVLGLGAGVGAGVALKPPAPATDIACGGPTEAAGHEAPSEQHGAPTEEHEAVPCAPDPFAPKHAEEMKHASELAYVPMDKPFVVPVFSGEKVVAMVVVSLSVETEAEAAPQVEGVKPRLRDSFLNAMFLHANSGGFDGSFTAGRKMEDLRAALLEAAQSVLTDTPVEEVLITEIARQEV